MEELTGMVRNSAEAAALAGQRHRTSITPIMSRMRADAVAMSPIVAASRLAEVVGQFRLG
jgi:hypothetical protein